jgi:NAD(P)-dependent dehydrogenase (short-subunit alcohol dehydrogenase family)
MLVGRGDTRLKDLAQDLLARGASLAQTVDMDLEQGAKDAPRYLSTWREDLGGIDHVLLFYGALGDDLRARQDMAALHSLLSVNFTSAACWCAASGSLLGAQKSGSLVAVSSVAGDRGRQSNFVYGAAKGGLALFVQGLAHALAPTGARAVALKPGFVDTPMTAHLPKSGPLWATPEAIAQAVRRAAERGGPIQYAPSIWKAIMIAVRLMPSAVFHRTRL